MLHKQSHQINRIIWNITHEFKKRKFNGHPVRRRLSHQKHLSHSFHDEYLVRLLWPHRIWTEKQNFWKRRSHYSPFPFTTIRNVSHMRLGIPNSCSWCLRGAIVIFCSCCYSCAASTQSFSFRFALRVRQNERICLCRAIVICCCNVPSRSLSLPLRCLRSVWRCLFDSAQFVRSVCVCVIYTSAVRSNVGKGRECTHQNCCHGMRVSIYVCSCSAIDSRLQLALYVNSCTFWPIHGCCSKLNNRPIWMKNPNEMVHRACFFSSWSRFWFDQEVRTSNSRVSWRFCSSCVGH